MSPKPPGEVQPLQPAAAVQERVTPPVMPLPLDVGDLTEKTGATAVPRLKKPKYSADEARYISAVVVAMGDEKTPGNIEAAVAVLKSGEKPEITADVARRYKAAREEYLDAKNQESAGHTEALAHDPYHRAVNQLKEGLQGDPSYSRYFGSFDPQMMAGKDVVTLWIDNYDEIFSDFDSSDYSKRQVSEDLVRQVRTALKNGNNKPVALRLQLAGEHFDQHTEEVVKKRIREHFEAEEKRVQNELSALKKRGWKGVGVGLVLLAGYKAIEHYAPNTFAPQLVGQYLDFAGFVMGFWGADQILIDSRPKMKEMGLFTRMKKADIFFEQY